MPHTDINVRRKHQRDKYRVKHGLPTGAPPHQALHPQRKRLVLRVAKLWKLNANVAAITRALDLSWHQVRAALARARKLGYLNTEVKP